MPSPLISPPISGGQVLAAVSRAKDALRASFGVGGFGDASFGPWSFDAPSLSPSSSSSSSSSSYSSSYSSLSSLSSPSPAAACRAAAQLTALAEAEAAALACNGAFFAAVERGCPGTMAKVWGMHPFDGHGGGAGDGSGNGDGYSGGNGGNGDFGLPWVFPEPVCIQPGAPPLLGEAAVGAFWRGALGGEPHTSLGGRSGRRRGCSDGGGGTGSGGSGGSGAGDDAQDEPAEGAAGSSRAAQGVRWPYGHTTAGDNGSLWRLVARGPNLASQAKRPSDALPNQSPSPEHLTHFCSLLPLHSKLQSGEHP